MTIDSQVCETIRTALGIVGPLTNEDTFWPDLGADSLDSVNLLLAFERDFDIEIDDAEALEVRTVQQAIDLVKEKLK
ncbi:MAG: acyl carrier protein [Candidatus Micrarchaeaceae archaeon]